MLRMCFEITIGSVKLKGIESVVIESSVDLLSDTCTITLPGAQYNKAYDLESKVKRGDAVLVRLGYNDELKDEFKGYLKSIHPNNPMKLECEDAAYLFRKPIKDKQLVKTSAAKIVRYILDEINAQLPEDRKMKLIADLNSTVQFDKFTIIAANGLQALEKVKSESGLAIYCRGRELHIHLAYTQKRGDVTYDFARNLEDSDDLEYVKAEDKKVRITVIGRTSKGKEVKIETGEKGGDAITLKRPTISDQKSLEKVAKQELSRVSYDGYKGAVVGWLIPFCQIGYSVKLFDQDYPKREGTYYANAVKTSFSKEGGRRTVTLGIRLSSVQIPTATALAATDAFVEEKGDVEGSNQEGVWA